MAYLSSSPPPMPMVAEDDEDDQEDTSIADVSESDDVTGLSDKLHSIPKEAIHITPKEFARSEGDEAVLAVLGINTPNGLGVTQDTPEDDIWSDGVSPIDLEVAPPLPDDLEEPEADVDDLKFDASEGSEHSDRRDSVVEEDEEVKEKEEDQEDPESLKLDFDVGKDEFEPYESAFGDPPETENTDTQQDANNFGDFANFDEAAWVPPDTHIPIPVAVEQRSELVLDEEEDEGNDGTPPDAQLGDDDDDDFGDFDSASDHIGHVGHSSPRDILSVLHPTVTPVINDLFSSSIEMKDPCDKVIALNPNPAEGDGGDPVWTQIYEIETTPALGLNWSKTTTQGQLMKLLKMDPRNIVLESKPRKYSPGNVPAFAMGLSTSTVLQPVKVENIEQVQAPKHLEINTEKKVEEKVPKASFDWQTSGLRNPLDHNGGSLHQSHISTPTSEATVKNVHPANASASTITSKPRSREAVAILESFPLLNFMQAQSLIVPINDSTQ